MVEAKSVITTQVKIESWPKADRVILMVLLFFFDCIGDSVGSTGGEIFGK